MLLENLLRNVTKESLRKLLVIQMRGKRLIIPALLFSLLSLPGCKSYTRAEVKAEIFLNSGIPAKICQDYPEVAKSGIYRKLNDGNFEFLSYCHPEIVKYYSLYGPKFEEVLDALLPENKIAETPVQ